VTLRPDRREGGRTKPAFGFREPGFGPSSFPSVRPKSHSFFPYFLSYNLVINVRKGRKEGSFGLPSFLPYIKVFVNKLVGGKEGGPSGLPSPQPIYTRILCSRQGGGRNRNFPLPGREQAKPLVSKYWVLLVFGLVSCLVEGPFPSGPPPHRQETNILLNRKDRVGGRARAPFPFPIIS